MMSGFCCLTDESNYRFTSYDLFCGIRDGIKRLNSVRPESRYFGLALVLIDFPSVDVDMTEEEIATVRDTVVLVEALDRGRCLLRGLQGVPD